MTKRSSVRPYHAPATGGQKRCASCALVLPYEDFQADKRMASGRMSYCRACSAARHREARLRFIAQYSPEIAALDGVKRCSGCKAERSLSEFYVRREAHNGRSTYCRICTILRVAKDRARTAGLPFDLTTASLHIPTHCPALGIPLSASAGRHGDDSPSLDRIRPELGYVVSNVEVVSWLYNRLKSNITDPAVFEKVAAHMRRRTP